MTVIDRLWRRIMGIVAIGRINTVNDANGTQLAQTQANALAIGDNLPVLAHFGFSSNAPAGALAVTIYGSGDRSNGVVIATGDAGTRPVGNGLGETVVYNAFEMSILLSAAGITINGGGKPLTITNVPTLVQDGDIHATGSIIAGFGGADQVGLTTHKHPAEGSAPEPGT